MIRCGVARDKRDSRDVRALSLSVAFFSPVSLEPGITIAPEVLMNNVGQRLRASDRQLD